MQAAQLEDGLRDMPWSVIGRQTVWGHQIRWASAGNISSIPTNPHDVDRRLGGPRDRQPERHRRLHQRIARNGSHLRPVWRGPGVGHQHLLRRARRTAARRGPRGRSSMPAVAHAVVRMGRPPLRWFARRSRGTKTPQRSSRRHLRARALGRGRRQGGSRSRGARRRVGHALGGPVHDGVAGDLRSRRLQRRVESPMRGARTATSSTATTRVSRSGPTTRSTSCGPGSTGWPRLRRSTSTSAAARRLRAGRDVRTAIAVVHRRSEFGTGASKGPPFRAQPRVLSVSRYREGS